MFFEKVDAQSKVLQEMGNPFQEGICDLTLDTKDIADLYSVKAVTFHHEKGKQQPQVFFEGMQHDTECTFYKTIRKAKWLTSGKNKLPAVPRIRNSRKTASFSFDYSSLLKQTE